MRLTYQTTRQKLYADLLLGVLILALALLVTTTTLPLLVRFAPELIFALAVLPTKRSITSAVGLCQPHGHGKACSSHQC